MKIFAKLVFSLALFFSMGNLTAQQSHLFTEDDTTPSLVPQAEFSANAKEFVFGKINVEKMGFAAEKLYLLKKSEIENKNQSQFNTETVSKIMRSISKMQGMQYFSRSRKVWNTLYSEAYRIEDPRAKKLVAVADITNNNANDQEIFAFLNDHTFGESVYKITYKQNQNELLMLMENNSVLSYGPVKAVKPGNLKMCVLIIDNGDDFVVYMGNYTEFKMPSMLKTRLNNSFEARLEAIYNWFKIQF